jgi:hypothetical protein
VTRASDWGFWSLPGLNPQAEARATNPALPTPRLTFPTIHETK